MMQGCGGGGGGDWSQSTRSWMAAQGKAKPSRSTKAMRCDAVPAVKWRDDDHTDAR